MHSGQGSSDTHRHSHIYFWGRVQYENQVGYNVTFSTPTAMSATVGSHARSAYPIIRKNLSLGTLGRSVRNASTSSSILGRSERNSKAEAKSLGYNGSLEWGCFTPNSELWQCTTGGWMTTGCWPYVYRSKALHLSLTWLINFRHPEGQLERWLEELNQYYMTIILRPGKKHLNADTLSRGVIQPCGPLGQTDTLEDVPCGGCHYCRRAPERWQDFSSVVNDVKPLASLFSEETMQT